MALWVVREGLRVAGLLRAIPSLTKACRRPRTSLEKVDTSSYRWEVSNGQTDRPEEGASLQRGVRRLRFVFEKIQWFVAEAGIRRILVLAPSAAHRQAADRHAMPGLSP